MPKLLQEIKLKHAIEKQMKVHKKQQAKEEQFKARERAKTEDLLKAYEVNKPKVKPINPAKEIEALLSKYR